MAQLCGAGGRCLANNQTYIRRFVIVIRARSVTAPGVPAAMAAWAPPGRRGPARWSFLVSGPLLSDGSGKIGGDDIGGMPVETGAGAVIARRRGPPWPQRRCFTSPVSRPRRSRKVTTAILTVDPAEYALVTCWTLAGSEASVSTRSGSGPGLDRSARVLIGVGPASAQASASLPGRSAAQVLCQ
jgi:hypothetical protein